MNELIIERPRKKDIESICKVFETTIPDAFEKEGLGYLKEDMLREIESKKNLLRLAVSTNDMFFLLAKIKDEVVGTISFSPCSNLIKDLTDNQISNVGELGSLYVLPSFQGRGVASALIHALMELLHKNGVKHFCLDSGYKNAQSRWLQKFGVPYTIEKNYWGNVNDHMIWLCEVEDYI